MSDKPVAALVAFLFVFPLTVVCCAGPAALVSGVVATVAWLSQSMVLLVVASAAAGAFVLLHVFISGRGRRCTPRPEAETGCSATTPGRGSEFG